MNFKKLTPKKFSLEIERISSEKNINHLDSVVYYCDKNKMEIETVTKLITKALKQKIEADASTLKLIKSATEVLRKLFAIYDVIVFLRTTNEYQRNKLQAY